jgi:hypothetical protein
LAEIGGAEIAGKADPLRIMCPYGPWISPPLVMVRFLLFVHVTLKKVDVWWVMVSMGGQPLRPGTLGGQMRRDDDHRSVSSCWWALDKHRAPAPTQSRKLLMPRRFLVAARRWRSLAVA